MIWKKLGWALSICVSQVLLAGCGLRLENVQEPGRAAGVPTSPPSSSMVYAARTDEGVIVVDLGWIRSEEALRKALGRVGADSSQVTDVFLTHSHRDHIGAWEAVRTARFHMAEAEVPLFLGQVGHTDLPSRAAERSFGEAGAWPGEVAVRPFSRDTAFVLGADTLRAFLVPGHTPGSTAYLFRGVLFTGDAISYSYLTGFHGAMGIFTDDKARSRESLVSLRERVSGFDVQWVCTAHAKCVRPDSAFWGKVLQ